MTISVEVNGSIHSVDADPGTPLLYVLRDDLELNGAKYGCGLGQCGACTVHLDGEPIFSCLTPVGSLEGRKVRTIEALGTVDNLNPLQSSFEIEQAAQCGYCIAGMIMRAQALLDANPNPTDDEIISHMHPNLCRCGTHARILRAIRRASDTLIASRAKEAAK